MDDRDAPPQRRARPGAFAGALALALFVAACGGGRNVRPDAALDLSFEDRETPDAFSRDGVGRRAGTDAGGLWAAVAGLPRPERALLQNTETGASVEVALFRARAGTPAQDIQLSAAAADALGIGDAPAPVRVVALRREPSLAADADRF